MPRSTPTPTAPTEPLDMHLNVPSAPKRRPRKKKTPPSIALELNASHEANDQAHVRVFGPAFLAQVSPLQARLSRVLNCASRRTRLSAFLMEELELDQLDLNLLGSAPFVSPMQAPAALELSLQCSHASCASTVRVTLDLHEYPLLGYAAIHTSPASDQPLNQPLGSASTAFIALLVDRMMAVFMRMGVFRWSVLGLTQASASHDTSETASLCVTYASAQRKGQLLFQVDPIFVSLLESFWVDTPSQPAILGDPGIHPEHATRLQAFLHTSALGKVKLPGVLLVGAKNLNTFILNKLKPGDVVLNSFFSSACAALRAATLNTPPQKPASSELASLTAIWRTDRAPSASCMPALTTTVDFNFCAITLLEPLRMSDYDDESNEHPLEHNHERSAHALENLEIPIQLELHTINLSLQQLSSLEAGYVIELPQPITALKIRLVAHGQTIGYGEPVAIGEQLGLRITHMARKNASTQ